MRLLRRIATTVILSFMMFGVAVFSLPMKASASVASNCDKSFSFLGLPTWYAYLDVGPEMTVGGTVIDKCAVIGPRTEDGGLDWPKAIPLIGLAVLEIMLRIAGLAGLFFVMYGGFKYITSQGEPDKTKQSRQTITNALIGIAISIIASAAVSFIANTLTT